MINAKDVLDDMRQLMYKLKKDRIGILDLVRSMKVDINMLSNMAEVLDDLEDNMEDLTKSDQSNRDEIIDNICSGINAFDAMIGASHYKRKFPKRFYVQERYGKECMFEEIIDSHYRPLYCNKEFYDILIEAAIDATREEGGFDRFVLLRYAQARDEAITKHACMLAVHLWMSVNEDILDKKSDQFSKMSIADPNTFRQYALDQWDLVKKQELIVKAPKGFEER